MSSSPGPASSLPANVTSFIGRKHDLSAVETLFSVTRLVTLTGIGGVGKTRLALQVARAMSARSTEDVHLVDLSDLTEADLLPQTVLSALGLRGESGADPVDVVLRSLADRPALLVLDNCEHLVEAAAGLVDTLLRHGPDVRILATSRQPLRLDGEFVYPVNPLLTPAPSASGPGTSQAYPSVKLFVERAGAVDAGFALTADNEEAVARVCQRLDGIPLALELAARRLRVLSVDQIADRLDDRFRLLTSGSRNHPARHQTLEALVDWTFDLCTPDEQCAWMRSSVFAGGFSLDALESVALDDDLTAADLLDAVTGLVEKSVLSRVDHPGQPRFRMLETIRDFGRLRLDRTGELESVGRRHRDWFAGLVTTATREWAGPRQVEWATQARLDHPNIRLALEFSISRPEEAAIGVEMAARPWFWASLDHLNEASLWLDRGIPLLRSPSRELAWALANRGYIAAFQGEDELLNTLPDAARAMALELDDRLGLALANHVIGFRQSLRAGDIHKAIPLFTQALEQYDAAGAPALYRWSVIMELATTYAFLREFDLARECTEKLYDECAAVGERLYLSYALWLKGLLALLGEDDPVGAERQLLEALRTKRLFKDVVGLGLTLEVLSWCASARDHAERAAVIMGGADRVWKTVGARHLYGKRAQFEAQARTRIGDTAFETSLRHGATLDLDEIASFALEEDAAGSARAGDAPTRLTPREREVAGLVAEGLSNREIAARLVISIRTVEGHVEKILDKRGFRKRAQIASWMARETAVASSAPDVR